MRLCDLSRIASKQKLNDLRNRLHLTDEELQIFDAYANNQSTEQISYKMGLSVRTVERRSHDILLKIKEVQNDSVL